MSLWKGSGPLMCSPSRVPHSTRMLLIRFLNHSSFCSTFGPVGVHYHWLLYQVESLRGREGLSSGCRGLRFTIMERRARRHEGNLVLAAMLSVLSSWVTLKWWSVRTMLKTFLCLIKLNEAEREIHLGKKMLNHVEEANWLFWLVSLFSLSYLNDECTVFIVS